MMKLKLLAAGITLISAFNAQAIPVNFGAFTAEWLNPVAKPGANQPVASAAGTNPTIRWGSPATASGQSGYNFDSESPFSTEFDTVMGMSDIFELGTFTHLNNPIYSSGSSLLSVDLKLSTTVQAGALPAENVDFLFSFTHEETPNSASPCAYGPAGQTGVNVNGCADRVTTNTNAFTDVFSISGVDYTVDIRGFTVGGNFVDGFLTKEKVNNQAIIIAKITAFEDINEVPEPAPFAILGAGLLGLGAVRRMKKNKAVTEK